MKLCVLNGSPRKGRGNTQKLLDNFMNGFLESGGNTAECLSIIDPGQWNHCFQKMEESEIVWIGFPLYFTAMPGNVKGFLEQMPICGCPGKKIGVFVQSGFPEAYQISWMNGYFEALFSGLGYFYLGIVFQGFGASIEEMPPMFSKEMLQAQTELGRKLGRTGQLDKSLVEKIHGPEEFSAAGRLFYRLIIKLGMADMYPPIC